MESTTGFAPDARTPLLNGLSATSDRLSGKAIHLGLFIFAALVVSVLLRIPFTVFSYHPIFMTLFLILVIEGVSLLQPTHTAAQKARGLQKHAITQALSYISIVSGFTAIFYNKVISKKEHFTSAHGQLGILVFSFMLVQVVFGLTIAYAPRLFGGVSNAKQLWKYHRMSGYTVLALVWLTAQLGVRADYMLNNLWSQHLLWLHVVSTVLVIGGIAVRVRTSKWGLA